MSEHEPDATAASVDGGWAGATPSMADSPRARPRGEGPGQPKMLIMDVCGAYMRPLGGWFAISTIVRLMNELSVDESATRSALLRMRRNGLLEPERRGGQRGFRLSDAALPLLSENDRRIFGQRSPARLADGWVLLSASIPEEQRSKRHVLRSRLAWLGFGNIGNGLWIAPHRMLRHLEKAIAELGYDAYVMIFTADYHGPREAAQLARTAWDLDEIGALYAEFLRWSDPVVRRWEAEPAPDDRQAYLDYTLTLYHWRKFPYLDPGLPADLLPRDWAGNQASRRFFDLRDRLEDRALAYVRRVCGTG